MFVLFTLLLLCATAGFAQEAVTTTTTTAASHSDWAKPMAAALVLGLAAAFGALGQGKAISAACEGIARNPGAAGPIRLAMLIGLALIESLVIYALVLAFVLNAN
jgi:F-type H+-transporting ATPase subunit c